MGKYILGPNGNFVAADELYHGLFGKGKPRDDHKYIKREWKKGKWVYTYPSDAKRDKKSTNTFRDNIRSFIGVAQKERFEKAVNNLRSARDKTDRTMDAHDRLQKRAMENGTWDVIVRNVKKSFDEEDAALTEYKLAKSAYEDKLLGKLDKAISKGKKQVLDWMGYDEKANLESVTKTVGEDRKMVREWAEQDRKAVDELHTKSHTKDHAVEVKRQEKLIDRYLDPSYDNARLKEAKTAFANTPLGKIEKLSQSGREWYERVFGKDRTGKR